MNLTGFGNYHQTESIANALPLNQNSPQHCPLNLYAEQISGSAFSRPRPSNLHTWFYRKLPSVLHQDYTLYEQAKPLSFIDLQAPNPYRWSPLKALEQSLDFIDGLFHIAGNQQAQAYIYQCTKSMEKRYFCNNDGEMLFIPYEGEMVLFTELGKLTIKPGMIGLVPRGIKFKVELNQAFASGYLCENTSLPFTLPSIGITGPNVFANPRHFVYPKAAFEEDCGEVSLICKNNHHLWIAQSPSSPLNVVAWQGNYAPYSYDLSLFTTINSVSFDHPDPSIFTVLTSESEIPGIANVDFVIFPSRWMVSEHTFRPPYFHRNIMNELMGLIEGEYDAKQSGFSPGGVSIHNCMTAHGPDCNIYEAAVKQTLKPMRYENTLAFMLETKAPWLISKEAFNHPTRQKDYGLCWKGFKKAF